MVKTFFVPWFTISIFGMFLLVGCGSSPIESTVTPHVSSGGSNTSSTLTATTTTTHSDSASKNEPRPTLYGPIIPTNLAFSYDSATKTTKLIKINALQDDWSDLPLGQAPNQIPILMYHSISDRPGNTLCVAPNRFTSEMEHLSKSGYHPLSFPQLADAWLNHKPIPAKPILITFDDGYKDNYTAVYPVLKKLSFSATIFIVTHFVDRANMLSWQEIQEMDNGGLIQFGSHTIHHLDLNHLSTSEQQKEIEQSKLQLEQRLGHNIDTFCYPSGRYNTTTVKLVQQAGYTFAVTTHPGDAALTQGQWTLNRVRVSGDETEQAFAKQFP